MTKEKELLKYYKENMCYYCANKNCKNSIIQEKASNIITIKCSDYKWNKPRKKIKLTYKYLWY